MPDNGNPFKDDKPLDPNAPPATRQETYKPYFKKGANTVATPAPTPARRPEPTKLDPYAQTEPVHIKARPVTAQPRVARVESYENVAPVSLTISDDAPPSPPALLPAPAPFRHLEGTLPSNPLRR
jgi:hypothetical protein